MAAGATLAADSTRAARAGRHDSGICRGQGTAPFGYGDGATVATRATDATREADTRQATVRAISSAATKRIIGPGFASAARSALTASATQSADATHSTDARRQITECCRGRRYCRVQKNRATHAARATEPADAAYPAYATDPAISRLTANSDKAAGHDRTDCPGTGAALATRPANAADAADAAH